MAMVMALEVGAAERPQEGGEGEIPRCFPPQVPVLVASGGGGGGSSLRLFESDYGGSGGAALGLIDELRERAER